MLRSIAQHTGIESGALKTRVEIYPVSMALRAPGSQGPTAQIAVRALLASRMKSDRSMSTSEMIVAIGLEAIGQGVDAEDRSAWQVQIGVTRVGAGGRAMPRCRNGRMTCASHLVAATIEPQELVSRPHPVRKPAPLARAIAFMTVAVLVVRDVVRGGRLLNIIRAIWHALVPSRRGVSLAARQAWHSAREMGIDLPSIWAATTATSA